MNSALKIAIIGGGPGGLTLARILQCHGMKHVTVYEHEKSRHARGQGGCLDLHRFTGQYALKKAKLFEEFKKLCRYEGQDLRVLDKHAKVFHESITSGNQNDRPEIDRSVLRNMLLDSLHHNTVQWGHSMTGMEKQNTGAVQINFENGEKTEADFVIGADGAWSKVRPYLTPVKPIYSGISMLDILLTDVDKNRPDLANIIGRGLMYSLAPGRGIIGQKNNTCYRVYVTLKVPEDWFETVNIDFKNVEQAKSFLLTQFESWDEKLLDLIRYNSGEFVQRPIYALPIGHSWERDVNNKGNTLGSRITLLGDAAHLMSPFAGQGVNQAMADAASLAKVLSSKGICQRAIKKYEREMCSRSLPAAKLSASNLEVNFGPNGPAGLAARLKVFTSWYFPVLYGAGMGYLYITRKLASLFISK